MAASTLRRSKTALGAAYRRIARQRSAKVAVFAVARKLAQLVYRLLRHGQPYVDIGERQYEARYEQRRLRALQENARQLGYNLVREAAVP